MAGKDDNPLAVGTICLEVPKLAELKTRLQSPVVYIANMPWYIYVVPECSERTSNIKQFSFFTNCNEANKSPHWSCEASVILSLLSTKVGQKSRSKTFVHTFCTNQYSWGYPSFMAWDKVLKSKNGFFDEEDGGAVVEAMVTVRKVIGLPMSPLNDFATWQSSNFTNVTLLVEEKQVYINKQFLAMHSPVFHELFFTNIAEKDEKVVPLSDVKHDEFVLFLNVFHPSRMPVTADTVEFLLRLADRFDVRVVLCECENFLCCSDSKEITLPKKLLWSDRYSLATLQFLCFNELKTIDDIKGLSCKKEYRDLTDKAKAALVDRILELC